MSSRKQFLWCQKLEGVRSLCAADLRIGPTFLGTHPGFENEDDDEHENDLVAATPRQDQCRPGLLRDVKLWKSDLVVQGCKPKKQTRAARSDRVRSLLPVRNQTRQLDLSKDSYENYAYNS
jgi:hypothetical protein